MEDVSSVLRNHWRDLLSNARRARRLRLIWDVRSGFEETDAFTVSLTIKSDLLWFKVGLSSYSYYKRSKYEWKLKSDFNWHIIDVLFKFVR